MSEAGQPTPAAPCAAVTALVLAGGRGTRLRDVLADRQKVVAAVAGRPMLAHLLEYLRAAGVRRTILAVGYRGDQVRAALGDSWRGMALEYSDEAEPLGTAGAIRHALPLLDTDPVLVLNGDSFVDVHLGALLAWHRGHRARASLVLARVPDPSRYGLVEFGAGGEVTAFREKGDHPGDGGPCWINAGVYLLGREVLESISPGHPASLERDVLPGWVGRGLVAFPGGGRFIDIGTPESYQAAGAFFASLPSSTGDRTDRGGTVFLDRDGTIIAERHYLADGAEVALLPGAAAGLRRMRELGWRLVIVTNQSGLARGYFDRAALDAVHARMQSLLAAEGVVLDGVFWCPHHPSDGCACRKPAPGLVDEARRELGVDLARAVVVGDKTCDVELGRRLGLPTVLVTTGYGREELAEGRMTADFAVDSLVEAADLLRGVGLDALRQTVTCS